MSPLDSFLKPTNIGKLNNCSAIALMFGLYPQLSVFGGIVTLPIFVWELSLGIWFIVKGFRPSPVLDFRSQVPFAH